LTGVRLRLSIYGGNKEEEEARIETALKGLREIIGDHIWSEEDDSFEALIGRMLVQSGKTLSAAESCTGGLISELLTSVPGSSAYYLGSVTSYANSVKTGVLGVPEEIILTHGAVSSECVAAMAEGVRRITGSDFSVATSGIAGPSGGSEDKPVGLVWIAVSSETGTETFSHVFKNNRKQNIERFAASALNHLRKKILKDVNH
jgi:nicotinamide-nucleotide amidase